MTDFLSPLSANHTRSPHSPDPLRSRELAGYIAIHARRLGDVIAGRVAGNRIFQISHLSSSRRSTWLKLRQVSTVANSRTRKSQWKSADRISLLQEVCPSQDAVDAGIADAIRSSLGPKGMDKMIQTENTTIITNDGATILKHMAVLHPAARMVSLWYGIWSNGSWLIFLQRRMLKLAMGLPLLSSSQEVSSPQQSVFSRKAPSSLSCSYP